MKLTKAEVQFLVSLRQKKVRDAERVFLVEGWKTVGEVADSSFTIRFAAFVPARERTQDQERLLASLRAKHVHLKEMSEPDLRRVADTVHAQGIVAVVEQSPLSLESAIPEDPSLVVVCDVVNDPGNLGTIIRSADWYAADFVLLGAGSVSAYNEKVVRATAGSLFHVPVIEDVNLPEAVQLLRESGFRILAAEADGDELPSSEQLSRIALILGNEAHGISPDLRRLADSTVGIPRFGRAESLNVGVACAVLLDRIRRHGNHSPA